MDTVRRDHKPLIPLSNKNLENASHKQLHQIDFISQFTTDIVYVKGDKNDVADAMLTVLDPETILQAQKNDGKLTNLA